MMVIGLGAGQKQLARRLSLVFSLVSLGLTLFLWLHFKASSGELQFEEQYAWIPSLAAQYHLGIDGLGLLMLMLSAIVVPMAMLASWKIEERVPIYFALVLFLQAGLFGTFTALNFFHWFIFWELSLIPAFLLIKLWGGPLRSAAAMQFFIYTMVGSVAMLLAFLAIFLATGKTGERGRFDAAHELGHLVLHGEHQVPSRPAAEAEANRFAAAFLMPRAGVLGQGLPDATPARILEAKRIWKVSAMALTHRLHELDLLTEWGYRTACVQLSRLGYRYGEPRGIERES